MRCIGRFAAPAVLSGLVGLGPSQTLHAQTPVHLDTLEVTVSSRVSPGLSARTRTLDVITREELAGLPARSVGDLLRWANAVDLQQRSGAQADVSLRGAGFEQVLVLVDGVRVSDVQTGHFDLDLTVPLDRIERVEILRGPASSLFGADAVGGVVNVVTRSRARAVGSSTADEARPPTGSARAEGGSFGTLRLSATQALPVGSARLSLGEEWSESDGDRSGTDYRNRLLHGALDAPLAGGVFNVMAGYSARDFGAADFYAPIPAYEETRTGRVTAGWRWGDEDGLGVAVHAAFRDHDDLFVFFRGEPERGQNEHHSRQLGGELLLRHPSAADWASVAVGLETWLDKLDSSNLGVRSESRAAVFGEMVASPGPTTTLTFGARWDTHEAYGDVFSPSLSLAHDLTAAVRLKSSVTRSFRAPTWTERHYADPFHQASAGIDPERSWSYEAGVEVAPDSRITLGITAFRRDTEALIDWAKPDGSSDDVKWVTRNVKEATFTGLELDASGLDLAGASWKVGLSILGLEAAGEGGFFSKRALQPETQRVTLAASRPFGGRFRVAARGLHAKRRSQEAYHQVDVRLAADLPRGSVYVDLVNLTRQDYLDASGKPVPGVGAFLGYRIGG